MTRWQTFEELCGFLRAALHRTPPKAADDLGWEQLIEASSYHYVTPFLASSLKENSKLDPAVRSYLEAVLTLNAQRNQQHIAVVERVAHALNAIDIVPIFIKGAAYLSHALYPAPNLRVTGDIDLLLPDRRAPEIKSALKLAGFVEEETLRLVRAEKIYLPNFRDPLTGAVLDIHTAVAPPQWRAIVEPTSFVAIWRKITLGGAHLRTASPTDLVAHSVVHNQLKDQCYHRKMVHLRQLLDLHFLCDRFEHEIDWAELESRFARSGVAHVLSTNFYFVEALLHRTIPQFQCPHRPFALGLLRAMIENPKHQQRLLLTEWLSSYAGRLQTSPLTVLNLLNLKTFKPRLRQLSSILRERKW